VSLGLAQVQRCSRMIALRAFTFCALLRLDGVAASARRTLLGLCRKVFESGHLTLR
jgi:hypothetical protein